MGLEDTLWLESHTFGETGRETGSERGRVIIELTAEASSAGAVVSAGHVLAGSSVHTRVGFALVVVDVTVGATPARVTETLVAAMQGNEGSVVVLCLYPHYSCSLW